MTTKTLSPSQRSRVKRPRALIVQPQAAETPLTPAELLFCQHYLAEGFNGTAAYRLSHPNAAVNTAQVEASKFLCRPMVQAQIARNVAELTHKIGYTAHDHFQTLVTIATLDLADLFTEQGRLRSVREMPKPVRQALDSVEIKTVTVVTTRRGSRTSRTQTVVMTKVRCSKRLEALEQLGRFHNLQSLPAAKDYQPAFILTDTEGPSAH